ncbi:DUF4349 domain-containing protein [Candidatus Roizmanbacteria bacterium]|nr:DUF4349 domain-containing protein [Candidatus Roizmanbacteria bacterium]
MSRLLSWIRSHKLAVILIVIILWLLFRSRSPIAPLRYESDTFESRDTALMAPGAPAGIGMGKSLEMPQFGSDAPPTTNVSERMVVRNSHLSLKVKNVPETSRQIISYVESKGGYMVDSSISNPEDAASGSLTVRVPEETFDETLEYFRSLSMKVVSENLTGSDVTDQYQDIQERLAILERNKARFDEIMEQAVEIDDILRVQQEIFNLQNQIDSLKGQQQYLEQTAKLSLVTVYLATDELSLPYAPEQPWRPQVVFQKAVRSLLTNLQDVGSLVIWLAVYSIILIPLGVIAYIVYRRLNRIRRTPGSSTTN